jgi:single-strand DNA-binding protein
MTSYNRVILTGRVAGPPRFQYRPDGSPVIQFPLELNDSKDPLDHPLHRQGAGQRGRSLIPIVAFGKLAELNLDLLQNGQHLLVVGQLNQRNWQTPEGKRRILTEVIATDLRTLEETNQT